MRAFGLALLAAPLAACGFGLHQTAKTQPPGTVSLVNAFSYVSNSNISAQSNNADPLLSLGSDLGLRVGLSQHVDMGASLLYVQGLLLDTKMNLLERSNRLAIAPRLGLGFAENDDRATAVLMAGLIGSYDIFPSFTPYAGATLANHWIKSPEPAASFASGEHLAPPTGTGDGVLELAAGVQWRTGPILAITAEYGLWLPMQNDPGTFYAFVTTHFASLGFRFCLRRRCD